MYKLFSWNQNINYKITGTVHKNAGGTVLLFSAEDATLSLDKTDFDLEETDDVPVEDEKTTRRRRKRITAYPKEWADSFGEDYYIRQAKEQALANIDQVDEMNSEHTTYTSDDGKVTTPDQAAHEIKEILEDFGIDE